MIVFFFFFFLVKYKRALDSSQIMLQLHQLVSTIKKSKVFISVYICIRVFLFIFFVWNSNRNKRLVDLTRLNYVITPLTCTMLKKIKEKGWDSKRLNKKRKEGGGKKEVNVVARQKSLFSCSSSHRRRGPTLATFLPCTLVAWKSKNLFDESHSDEWMWAPGTHAFLLLLRLRNSLSMLGARLSGLVHFSNIRKNFSLFFI